MRIAIVGPTHPYKGGIARHTTELAHRLEAAGHQVVVMSWRAQYPEALYPGRQTLDDPEADPFPNTRYDLAWFRPDTWSTVGARLGRGADLVVLTVASPVQIPAALAIRSGVGRRARVVALCHNVLPHERRPGDRALVRLLLRRVDTVLTHSAQEADRARGLVGSAPARVVHAPLPPHLPDTAPVADDGTVHRRLLFLGIVRPYKGVDVLLRALAAGPPDVGLTVAGEYWGRTGDDLRRLVRILGLTERVDLRDGYVPSPELPRLFAASDALVLPYRSVTATQNVWLAFSHHRPVLVSATGPLGELVRDGVDGLLTPPGDAGALTETLRRFYAPGMALRLRAGVPVVTAETRWEEYLEAVTGSGSA
ncbi:glycosyltransferase family 4 protein [Spiractinospora alimapuensis]|uniref:glycosyltransferase family 4 protein n=1 Tax=Spiractinospora alimapuensis TaxID=2820884 RepID=UPI001F41CD25|nr:glycosyltransferase family 4 protein [Spiractinospora alimapuensis]QVQ54393.1 glycosyltransferase family 4 protein [Spiractinospora alimapuensis]